MDAIGQLANSYKKQHGWDAGFISAGLNDLYVRYIAERRQDLADAAVLGLALDSWLENDHIDIDSLSPEVTEAFHLAFPHVSLESLNERSHEEILGFVNAWKGKLFEVEVQDQLNAGVQVGDWQLEAGQHAELADSATQPGWDLSIINDDGSVAEVIQLKATDSASYVNHALDRYPDINVIATSDIAAHADNLDSVSVADTSVHDVTGDVTDAINNDSASDALLHTAPATLIAATEIYHVMKGNKTFDEALESGGERVGMSVIAGAIGAAVATVAGPIGWIAAAGARMWMSNKAKQIKRENSVRYEKEINPRQQMTKSKTTRKEAKKAYQQLENITGRLLLEYKT